MQGLFLSTGKNVLDSKLTVIQNLAVGRNVSGQKWTGSLANAGRFGFALLWGDFLSGPAVILNSNARFPGWLKVGSGYGELCDS